MITSYLRAAFAAVVVVLVAGCSSFTPQCVAIPFVQPLPMLVSPVDGAVGVSVDVGAIVVTRSDRLIALSVVTDVASQSPIAIGQTVGAANGANSYALPKLAPATHYRVVATLGAGSNGGCGAVSAIATLQQLGSFTTQ